MILSNKLTVLRIVLVIPFMIFLLQESALFKIAALVILTIASLSDYMDGIIARKRNEVSTLGKFLDPLADKLFMFSAFIIFIQLDELSVPAWPVILIISREFIISSLRTLAISKGKIIAASEVGKFKTAFQFAAILVILILLITERYGYMAHYIIVITSLVTLYSGFIYLMKNRDILTG